MKKSKWVPVARAAILIFLVVLFFNAFLFFREVRRTVMYGSRSYGLETLNDYFDQGNYQQVYIKTAANQYADDPLSVDVSQYTAFGNYYHYYVMARTHEENAVYLEKMEAEKEKISWKKILNVIAKLESELSEN